MIVGLAGKKRSGKSSAAKALADAGFEVQSFAWILRIMIHHFLGHLGMTQQEILCAEENKEAIIAPLGVSLRYLLQTLGTEWGRELIHPDIWVMLARYKLNSLPNRKVVFDDVRFENEAQLIREMGGLVIHIIRDEAFLLDNHASENGILKMPGDVIVFNDSDLTHLLTEVLAALDMHTVTESYYDNKQHQQIEPTEGD
jgi:hypothetical protein